MTRRHGRRRGNETKGGRGILATALPAARRLEAPLIFRSHAPMCLMNYADNLETDGHFGAVARRA